MSNMKTKPAYTEEQINGLLDKISELKSQRDEWMYMAGRLYELPTCEHFPDWKETLKRRSWGEDCPVCHYREMLHEMRDRLIPPSSSFIPQPSAFPAK